MSTEAEKSNRDLYAVLELEPEATLDDIRRAFRTIAAKNHPDRHPGDAKAALRFKQINAAYQVLSDPDRKFQYDQLTAPIEDMALAPRPPIVADEEPKREEPVMRRRRTRRRKRGGKIAWDAGSYRSRAIGVTAASGRCLPDLRRQDAPGKGGGFRSDAGRSSPRRSTRPRRGSPRRAKTSPPRRPVRTTQDRSDATGPSARRGRSLPMRTVIGSDRWSFAIPTNWEDVSDAKGPRYRAPGTIGNYRPSVRLEVSAFNGDAAKYFEDLDKQVPRGVGIDGESWESDTTPDGLKREAHTVSGGAAVSRFVQYAVPSKGRGYVLTCDGPPNAFENVRPLCERILGSLRIKCGAAGAGGADGS